MSESAMNLMPDQALLDNFNANVLEKPEVFLTKNEAPAEQAKAITKYLFDLGKSNESQSLKQHGSALGELYIDGFDNEQIWEEIHMQNTPFISYLKAEIKALKSSKAKKLDHEDSAAEDMDDEAEMNLGLDDEDMGLEMEDTDQMEGISGEEDDASEQEGDEDDLAEDMDEDLDQEEEEEDEEEQDEDEELDDLDMPIKKKAKTSELDDDFFNLEEFNAMTEKQEQNDAEDKESDEEEEEIDYWADPDQMDSGDETGGKDDQVDAHDVGFADFFVAPQKGTTHRPRPKPKSQEFSFGDMEDMPEAKEEDEASLEVNELGDRVSNLFAQDEDEEEGESLSKFEKSQRKMKEQIEQLEQENVAGKNWTKGGEASSRDRPVNSLLEEDLDFETVSKPIPVITAELTKSLEDIIKERILSATYDDVVRKAPPNPKAFNPSSRVEISDEKSKKSLSELYEEEYVRETSSTGPVKSEKEAALDKKHEEITQLWQDLCQKLDSLSNWHYAPKPVKAELTVVTNAPAISMEEAIPVGVADAALLAPEEIYSTGKNPVKGDTEMDQAERKRKRSKAKRAKKAENRERTRKESDRKAEREARDRRLGREAGDKGNSKTIVRDKLDAVKALSGQKNISFIDRDGNKRSGIKGATKGAEGSSQGAKLKL
ncbi:U3 snoRNP protein [Lunasporangiospora selenospora]|uniref:U3 small nucleolar ribonucleoprotein protein MPP10 n=1 Tax=Lunasporangiospora selenospora TaxID=979761 RepID=A0A9P6FP25_9FUNG|nr:U3 snoRNP protein [Lunasporangiospora selenospora]